MVINYKPRVIKRIGPAPAPPAGKITRGEIDTSVPVQYHPRRQRLVIELASPRRERLLAGPSTEVRQSWQRTLADLEQRQKHRV
jgi:hypothetical protein